MNLSKHIGFRPTKTALTIVFGWAGLHAKVPSFSSTRIWLCRAGIAQRQLPIVGNDWIWFFDHSNQIGQEKILQIIGIRASDLPQPGETLSLDKMPVRATIPGISWTQDDVRREYKKLADRIAMPKYVVTDGASELRESVIRVRQTNERMGQQQAWCHTDFQTSDHLQRSCDNNLRLSPKILLKPFFTGQASAPPPVGYL